MYDVNVLGTLRVTQALLPALEPSGAGHRRDPRLHRRAHRLRGRRRLRGGQARADRARRDAAAGAVRAAGPGDRDRPGHGAHRRVRAGPVRRRRRPGGRGLRRGGRAAGRRGRRRLRRLVRHPAAPRQHRPARGPAAGPGRPAQGAPGEPRDPGPDPRRVGVVTRGRPTRTGCAGWTTGSRDLCGDPLRAAPTRWWSTSATAPPRSPPSSCGPGSRPRSAPTSGWPGWRSIRYASPPPSRPPTHPG